MKRHEWILVPFLLVACGGDDENDSPKVEASITDHADAVTDGGGDMLFELAIESADDEYDVTALALSLQPAEGDPIAIEAQVTDADADGFLGKDDSIMAVEPATDAVSAAATGTTYDVLLEAVDAESGEKTELWTGEWEVDAPAS